MTTSFLLLIPGGNVTPQLIGKCFTIPIPLRYACTMEFITSKVIILVGEEIPSDLFMPTIDSHMV
jgi:hypothetical protein